MNPPAKAIAEPAGRGSQTGTTSWADWFTAGRLAGLVAVFLFALYPEVILGTHSFFNRDFGLFTYPVAWHTHESFWRGEVPLWNPLNNTGVPFLAQWNTTVCYPPSLIYMLFPLPWSLNYFCLAHLVLAGVGMYLLAYRWTQNRLAASLAGLAFALSGLMLNCLMWTSNLAALSWQPLVILWVEQAWQRGGGRIVLAALAGAMQMLSGAPEIILLTWLLLGAFWLVEAGRKAIPWQPTLRRLLVVVLFVTGLAAIQLLPFLDLLAHSERDVSYTAANAWPMPGWGLANYLVPLFHCSPTALGSFGQDGQSWINSYYVGTGTVLLGLFALWRPGQLRIWCLAGVAAVGLVLALGNNGVLYPGIKKVVPVIGFLRYPIKFVALPTFAIPLLAAYGYNRFQHNASGGAPRGGRPLFILAALLLLGTAATLTVARWFPKPHDSWPMTLQSGAIRVLSLVAIAAALAGAVRARSPRLRVLIGVVILALTGMDAATAGKRVNLTVVTKAFAPLELNMSFRPQYGASRAMLSRNALSFLDRADTADPVYYIIGTRGALYENCNLLEDIPKVDGFCSLHLKTEREILALLYDPTNAVPGPLADFLGVAQVTAPDTIFAWRQRASFLPLATAGQQPVFAGPAETLSEIGSKSFDPRRTVYLPLSARGEVGATNFSLAAITPQRFRAHEVRLTVQDSEPAMVVVAQSCYHNWRAFVDGRPARLWRANCAYQAVEVPAGTHEVALRYVDWAFRFGTIISALTLAGCAWLWIRMRRV
jgi:hypothetical protein